MVALISNAAPAAGSSPLVVALFLLTAVALGLGLYIIVSRSCLAAILVVLFEAVIVADGLRGGAWFGRWSELFWRKAEMLPGGALMLGGAALIGCLIVPGWIILRSIKSKTAARDQAGGLHVEWKDVTAVNKKHKAILDHVTLSVEAGAMAAIAGPSGGGKSTLIKVLLGEYWRKRTGGEIQITPPSGGRLHRSKIRYVPQEDHLYPDLTVDETLKYAAGLRVSRLDAKESIDDVRKSLHLARQHDQLVKDLSGGQRRRLSIGVELMGHPQLLLLDEPTEGLDSGKGHQLMSCLGRSTRDPDHPCTVIVVTHDRSHLCEFFNPVFVINGAGQNAKETLLALGDEEWNRRMKDLDEKERRQVSRPEYKKYKTNLRHPWWARFSLRGLWMALRRQAHLVIRRRWIWWIGLLAMPAAGTWFAMEASSSGLQPTEERENVRALAILVTAAALTGSSLTYSDLVHDRDVLHRDHRVGASAACLLAAKALVFGALCLVIAAAIMRFFDWHRDLQPEAYGLTPRWLLFVVLSLVMLSSLGWGLLISAVAKTLEQAVTWNTVLALCQVALNGSLFPITHGLMQAISLLVPARLGFAAVASASNLNKYANKYAPTRDDLWDYNSGQFYWLLGGMAAIFVVAIVGATLITERHWHGKRR